MVEVKICGVCRPEDARSAAAAGATYIGVILAPGRARTRSHVEAGAILDAGGVRRVGVFVDEAPESVSAAARALDLDVVQLHGAERVDAIERIRASFSGEVWKAVRVRHAGDIAADAAVYGTGVDALLLDGWSAAGHGGIGARFDWEGIARSHAVPMGVRIVVAGGLTPENVADAVRLLRPAVVDVSSGVELSPGCKSPDRVRAFVAAARGVKGGT
ncbi:MAG TPA: phosphoribosylanthranilate isomerase [Longimicrobiales bacterium]